MQGCGTRDKMKLFKNTPQNEYLTRLPSSFSWGLWLWMSSDAKHPARSISLFYICRPHDFFPEVAKLESTCVQDCHVEFRVSYV